MRRVDVREKVEEVSDALARRAALLASRRPTMAPDPERVFPIFSGAAGDASTSRIRGEARARARPVRAGVRSS